MLARNLCASSPWITVSIEEVINITNFQPDHHDRQVDNVTSSLHRTPTSVNG